MIVSSRPSHIELLAPVAHISGLNWRRCDGKGCDGLEVACSGEGAGAEWTDAEGVVWSGGLGAVVVGVVAAVVSE